MKEFCKLIFDSHIHSYSLDDEKGFKRLVIVNVGVLKVLKCCSSKAVGTLSILELLYLVSLN